MSSSPDKKVALVTGAAGGMGKADVLALLESGWNIAACDRDESRLDRFKAETSGWADRIACYCVDVTSLKDVQEAVADATRLGPVLGVVNNAGIGSAKRMFRDIPVEDWRQMLDVHVIGAVHCVLATLEQMEAAGFGRIVNVSSYCAEVGSIGFSHYCAAKAALIGYSMSLALEEAEAGVTVNVVAGTCRHAHDRWGQRRDQGSRADEDPASPLRASRRGGGDDQLFDVGRGGLHHRARFGGQRRNGV